MDPILPWILGGLTLLGGIFGGISTSQQADRERERIEHEKEMARRQYELGKAFSDEQYDLQKNKAFSDLTRAENLLDQNVDLQMDAFNNSLLAQAYQVQDAQIGTESQIGQMEAAAGYSGVKGNETNSLLAAYAETNLDRSIEAQNRNNDSYLTNMLGQANNALDEMGLERDSWNPGGYRYESKEAQDNYNKKLADLGQDNFDWYIAQAQPDFLDLDLDYVTGIFGGASAGLTFGANMYNFGSNFLGGGGSSPADYMKGYRFAPGAR